MANYMIIRHAVSNYPTWKQGYDAHASERAAAGLTETHLLQDGTDENQVTIIFEATDLDRAAEFSQSEDLRQVMESVGVIGKPDIHFCRG